MFPIKFVGALGQGGEEKGATPNSSETHNQERQTKNVEHQETNLAQGFLAPRVTPVCCMIALLAALAKKVEARERNDAKKEGWQAKEIEQQKEELAPHFKPPLAAPVVVCIRSDVFTTLAEEVEACERQCAERKRRQASAVEQR